MKSDLKLDEEKVSGSTDVPKPKKQKVSSPSPTDQPPSKNNGLLQHSGPGRLMVPTDVLIPGEKGEKDKKLCPYFTYGGKSCRYGKDCRGAHITKLSELDDKNAANLKKFVKDNDHVQWTPGKGPIQG